MNTAKKIIGIDPGTTVMGFAIIVVENDEIKVETLGVIKLQKLKDHQTKLKEIFLQIQDLVEAYRPTEMAIETPFYGKNVQSMLKLGRAQGVSIAAGITMGLSIFEYSPKSIKRSVTGNGNASKEQVSAMLNNILKAKINNKYLDSTDALATAVCHHYQANAVSSSGKKYNNWKNFVKDNADRVG